MSGKSGQGIVRGDRSGHGGHGFRVRGRGIVQYTATLNKNNGLCSALVNNILDYVQKGAAKHIRMT